MRDLRAAAAAGALIGLLASGAWADGSFLLGAGYLEASTSPWRGLCLLSVEPTWGAGQVVAGRTHDAVFYLHDWPPKDCADGLSRGVVAGGGTTRPLSELIIPDREEPIVESLFAVFDDTASNQSPILIVVPSSGTAAPKAVAPVPVAAVERSLPFLGQARAAARAGEAAVHRIDVRAAFDIDGDGTADLALLHEEKDNPISLVVGKVGKRWVVVYEQLPF